MSVLILGPNTFLATAFNSGSRRIERHDEPSELEFNCAVSVAVPPFYALLIVHITFSKNFTRL